MLHFKLVNNIIFKPLREEFLEIKNQYLSFEMLLEEQVINSKKVLQTVVGENTDKFKKLTEFSISMMKNQSIQIISRKTSVILLCLNVSFNELFQYSIMKICKIRLFWV